jgi:hypothetical protein
VGLWGAREEEISGLLLHLLEELAGASMAGLCFERLLRVLHRAGPLLRRMRLQDGLVEDVGRSASFFSSRRSCCTCSAMGEASALVC